MAAAMDLTEWDNDPRLFLFTSLTSGSSHIVTATSRLETILKANKLPFQAIDVATDEKARRLWGRRAGKKKLPGLVKEGYVIGDLEEIEEWNEYGELKENVGPVPANNSTSAPSAAAQSSTTTTSTSQSDTSASNPMRDAAAQAASIGLERQGKPAVLVDQSKMKPLNTPAGAPPATSTATASAEQNPTTATAEKTASASVAEASSITAPPKAETMTSAPDDKTSSIATAAAESGSKDEKVSTKAATADSEMSTKPAESAQKTELPFRTKPTNTSADASKDASHKEGSEATASEVSQDQSVASKDKPEVSKAGEEATVAEPVEDEVETEHGREDQAENKTGDKAEENTESKTNESTVPGLEEDKDTTPSATSVEGTETSKVEEKGQAKDADEAGVSVED